MKQERDREDIIHNPVKEQADSEESGVWMIHWPTSIAE